MFWSGFEKKNGICQACASGDVMHSVDVSAGPDAAASYKGINVSSGNSAGVCTLLRVGGRHSMLLETLVTADGVWLLQMAYAEGLYCETPDRCEGHERTRLSARLSTSRSKDFSVDDAH